MRVQDPSVPIGRDESDPTSIVLDDPAVSANCVRLKRRDDATYDLVDEGSTNAVRVNGRRVRGSRELDSNDVIRLGDSLLVFDRDEAARMHSSAARADNELLRGLAMYESTAKAILFVETSFFDPEVVCAAIRAHGFNEMRLMADWIASAWDVEAVRIDATDGGVLDTVRDSSPDVAVVIERLDAADPAILPALVAAIEERVSSGFSPGRVAFTYGEAGARSLVASLLETVVGAHFEVPPLSERRADILPAIAGCLEAELDLEDLQMPAICAEKLLCYGWPGGVGELRRVAKRVARRYQASGAIDRLALPAEIRAVSIEPDVSSDTTITPESFEEVFVEYGGNLREIAKHYGYARTYLYRLLRQKGIDIAALREKHGF